MYENPYFGNPYLQQNQQRYGTQYQQPVQQMQAQQPAYNQMQQVPQQIQQPQLIGHIVDSQETIQASDVPMNAPYALFPKNDLSEIYLKSWTANGTIQTMLNVFSVILQMIGYDKDQKQTSNDDLLRALQRQDREYLEKIISNQNQILDILSKTNE